MFQISEESIRKPADELKRDQQKYVKKIIALGDSLL
jgi:chemotaxis signal transduction protein